MNELDRVKARAKEVKLSLEALASVKSDRAAPRSLPEALKEWESRPLRASPELLRTFEPAHDENEGPTN